MAAGLDVGFSPALSHHDPTGAPCHPAGCRAPLEPTTHPLAPAWSGVAWGWPVTGAVQPPAEVSPPPPRPEPCRAMGYPMHPNPAGW